MTKFSLSNQREMYKLHLNLWHRAVFIDWHGVLSTDLFWQSILSRVQHPYHAEVAEATRDLFSNERELVRDWMRGTVSSEHLVDRLGLRLDRRAKADYLLRRLLDDCRAMQYDRDLLLAIRRAAPDAYVIVATDNMDCFASRTHLIADLETTVDDILVSARLGVLKTDGVAEFFGPWLKHHGLRFADAVLIDDNVKTCNAFRDIGGTAIVHSSADESVNELAAVIGRFNGKTTNRRQRLSIDHDRV